MTNETAITGWGLATPLGADAPSTWESLLAGGCIHDHATIPVPNDAQPRVSQLAIGVAREAIASSGWSGDFLANAQTALVVATSKGPVERWLRASCQEAVPRTFGLAQVATDLAQALHLGAGPRLTISTACSSGLHALIRAAMMLQCGEARRAIVVAVESSLHPLFIASFQRLGILARRGIGCRPFDREREGFLLSEAAAAVCLEPGEGVNGAIWVERFRLAADATHLTGSDPCGAALRHCLHGVIDGRSVDLIHAHGTGTQINDPVELSAIESCIVPQEVSPLIYSHKGALGHSLGAAGLVSVVLNCLCHQMQTVPPNVQTRTPMPVHGAIIPLEIARRSIQRSIITASGFGGAIAALSLVSPPQVP